jgi:hypothetical protein
MSLYLDVVCTDAQIDASQRREQTVRVIGEILPFVLGKYGIAPHDRHGDAPRRAFDRADETR